MRCFVRNLPVVCSFRLNVAEPLSCAAVPETFGTRALVHMMSCVEDARRCAGALPGSALEEEYINHEMA